MIKMMKEEGFKEVELKMENPLGRFNIICKLLDHKYKKDYSLHGCCRLICSRCGKQKDVSPPQKSPPKKKSWKNEE